MDARTWSSLHPPGTRCTLTLADGSQRAAVVAGAAVGYGGIVVAPLQGMTGLWPAAWIDSAERLVQSAHVPHLSPPEHPEVASGTWTP